MREGWDRNDREVEEMRAAIARLRAYVAVLVVAGVLGVIATKALPNVAIAVIDARNGEVAPW